MFGDFLFSQPIDLSLNTTKGHSFALSKLRQSLVRIHGGCCGGSAKQGVPKHANITHSDCAKYVGFYSTVLVFVSHFSSSEREDVTNSMVMAGAFGRKCIEIFVIWRTV